MLSISSPHSVPAVWKAQMPLLSFFFGTVFIFFWTVFIFFELIESVLLGAGAFSAREASPLHPLALPYQSFMSWKLCLVTDSCQDRDGKIQLVSLIYCHQLKTKNIFLKKSLIKQGKKLKIWVSALKFLALFTLPTAQGCFTGFDFIPAPPWTAEQLHPFGAGQYDP